MAESEADTPSTPIEFESKYFEFDGVRLPPFCRGKMEEIAGFSLRSSDIWIVTYPKSGKQRARHRARQRCASGAPGGRGDAGAYNPTCSLLADAWLSTAYARAQQRRHVAFRSRMLIDETTWERVLIHAQTPIRRGRRLNAEFSSSSGAGVYIRPRWTRSGVVRRVGPHT